MGFGTLFLNDASSVLIDDNYFCLERKSKGTLNPATSYGPFSRIGTVTIAGVMPMLALRVVAPSSGRKGATIIGTEKVGSNWTFTVLVYNNAGSDFSVGYWVYDVPAQPSGWGLALWNANGDPVYNYGAPILDLRTGAMNAFLASSRIDYQENVNWDTIEQLSVIDYVYTASIYWCTAVSGGAVTGESVTLIGGRDFQPPNYGYENYGYDGGVLACEVSGQ